MKLSRLNDRHYFYSVRQCLYKGQNNLLKPLYKNQYCNIILLNKINILIMQYIKILYYIEQSFVLTGNSTFNLERRG